VAVAGVIGAGFMLAACGGGSGSPSASSGSPSASESSTSSQTKSQTNTTVLAAFAKSVTTDEQDTIGPQVQAITAAVTAGYQALDNGISSAGALEQQNLQQGTQQLSPNSPQFQQENQCVQAAGANVSEIDQCLQTAEQPSTSNEQAQSNAEAQAVQESDGDVRAAASAFSTLSAAFLGESQKLQDLGLTGRNSQLAAVLIFDYAKLGADCDLGESAPSIGATGTADHTLSTDVLKWVGDYNAFAAAVGLSTYAISQSS
jgi:hypothetical protein